MLYKYTYHVNSSCIKGLGCFGPYLGDYNWFDVWQDPETLEIHVVWKLTNGFSAYLDILGTSLWENQRANDPFNLDLSPLGLKIMAATLQPINGSVTVYYDPKSKKYKYKNLDRDPYPSLEIYQYYNGNWIKTLLQSSENWSAFIGLMPFAPNEKSSEE